MNVIQEKTYMHSSRKTSPCIELEKLTWKAARKGSKLYQHRSTSVFNSMLYNTDTNTHTGYSKTQSRANMNSEMQRLNQFFFQLLSI